MKIALTGDVMLGRLVNEAVIRNTALPPETVWGDVLPFLFTVDRRLCNLECVISSKGNAWHPESKAFHFRAHPRAIDVLKAARVDCVTLANNHSLDYGAQALAECLHLLDRAGIRHAGAGLNLEAALAPALLTHATENVAVIALTDNESEWEARPAVPGINYIDHDSRGLVEPYRSRVKGEIDHARRQAQFLIVSAHVGPNWGSPSPAMQVLAHDLLDLGADLYWGHSNHTPQGIELYHGKVILYSTGDLIDDYAVNPHARNDLSFLFVLDLDRTQARTVRLYPVAIECYKVRVARGAEITFWNSTCKPCVQSSRRRSSFKTGKA